MANANDSDSGNTILYAAIFGAALYYLDLKGIVKTGIVDFLGKLSSGTTPVPPSSGQGIPGPDSDESNLPSTPTPTSGGPGSTTPTPTIGGLDENGMKLLYKTTGKKVAMQKGTAHRNGQRYNVNHKFQNYMMQGYYKTVSNMKNIEMKTDGPCHGCGGNPCTSLPTCMWYEPDLDMNGSSHLGAEYPHPTNHAISASSVDLIKPLNVNLKPKWIGYAVVAYTNAAKVRVVEQWCDPDPFDAAGKPKNGWVLTLRIIDTGKVFPKQYYPRALPVNFKDGLEAEIRMNAGAQTPGTDLKWAFVHEIVPPA